MCNIYVIHIYMYKYITYFIEEYHSLYEYDVKFTSLNLLRCLNFHSLSNLAVDSKFYPSNGIFYIVKSWSL